MKGQRGIFERTPGSGVWWVCYYDANGKKRREKIGPKSAAIQHYQKRKTQVRLGEKLPENFRTRPAKFSDLADDTLAYSRSHKRSSRDDECRMPKVCEKFGDRVAEQITHSEIDAWLESHLNWKRATKNRYLALIKLTYRLAEKNGKVKVSPARLLRMSKENNERVRYLNQYNPLPTKLKYLRGCKDEESRLLAVIRTKYPFHLPEWQIALHTGMRRSEQYNAEWSYVNFDRKVLTLPISKHGAKRHVPLNKMALAAFRSLLPNMATSSRVFLNQDGRDSLRGNRHWFEDAVAEAGVHDFTWHDLRHTFASRLVMAGVSLRTVQELMGHKTINMTARYAHLGPAEQLAAVEKLVAFERPKSRKQRDGRRRLSGRSEEHTPTVNSRELDIMNRRSSSVPVAERRREMKFDLGVSEFVGSSLIDTN